MAWVILLLAGWAWGCSDVLGPPLAPQEEPRSDAASGDSSLPEPPSSHDANTAEVPGDKAPSAHTPYRQTWYGGQVMYQIFVRSFQDSDGDGIGDLKGITQRLDYLNSGKTGTKDDLKVAGMWLTPIFRSGSYHGYDTIDYRAIDPVYGTLEDFKSLVKAAHKRGMKVVLDLVLNHTSRAHPWFLDAQKGPKATRRDWYVWRDEDPGWRHPFAAGRSPWSRLGTHFYYALFSPQMPDLNMAHPPVQEALLSIMRHWLGMGVDGFRLDAVRYLLAPSEDQQADAPATHKLLKNLVASIRKDHPKAVFIGEAWTSTPAVARYFGQGDELDLCFQFDLVDAVDRAFQRGRASFVRTVLADALRHLEEPAFFAPILGNHDHKRLSSRLFHQPSALKLAATLSLTLPGTPFVYYGEEIGIGNANNQGDISKRAPMQWDDSAKAGFSKGIPWARLYGKQETVAVSVQAAKSDSLLSHYKRMIRLRRGHKALQHGTLRLLDLVGDEVSAGLAYLREDGGQRVLVLLNVSETKPLQATLAKEALDVDGAAPTGWQALLRGASEKLQRDAKGQLKLPQLPPRSAALLLLQP